MLLKQFLPIGLLIFAVLGIILVASRQRNTTPPASDASVRVTASFYPLAEFAKQVGGDLVSVTNLTPAGSEPHDFDPSPKDVAHLYASHVFIYNGAGLEVWVDRVLSDLQKNNVVIVDATAGMQLLSSREEDGVYDPHVWLSPKLAALQVRAIEKAFMAVDPSHAATYTNNAATYIAELEQLHQDFKTGTAQCKRREIVTSHAAFAYLAKEYGLTMVPIAGISPDEEPSPARLAEVARFVNDYGVTHIFFETLVSPALSETIAHETGARTIAFNPLEGLTEEEIAQGKSYISVQRENLAAIRKALDCI